MKLINLLPYTIYLSGEIKSKTAGCMDADKAEASVSLSDVVWLLLVTTGERITIMRSSFRPGDADSGCLIRL